MATTQVAPSLIQEILNLGGEITVKGLSREQFFELAAHHPELLMEQEKEGNINIMTPVKGGSGYRENTLTYYLTHWSRTNKMGMVFSPSTGFTLPDGSTRSPDVAWLSSEKMEQLSSKQLEEEYLTIVPDFIVELRSSTDRLSTLKQKMDNTWMANGVKMGWLIDPYEEQVHIYRLDGSIEVVKGFDQSIDGGDLLPGFSLDLSEFKLFDKSM